MALEVQDAPDGEGRRPDGARDRVDQPAEESHDVVAAAPLKVVLVPPLDAVERVRLVVDAGDGCAGGGGATRTGRGGGARRGKRGKEREREGEARQTGRRAGAGAARRRRRATALTVEVGVGHVELLPRGHDLPVEVQARDRRSDAGAEDHPAVARGDLDGDHGSCCRARPARTQAAAGGKPRPGGRGPKQHQEGRGLRQVESRDRGGRGWRASGEVNDIE